MDFDLIDIWRIRSPEIKPFTWRQKKRLIQKRLHFWLISYVCEEGYWKSEIISSINFEHSAISLHFSRIGERKHVLSFGKINASLQVVEDTKYAPLLIVSVP